MLTVVLATTSHCASSIRETKHNLSAIRETKHNLSANHAGGNIEDDELCVYCHTPNAAKSSFLNGLAWNKQMHGSTFEMYQSGKKMTQEESSSNPSLACLSCHDGINAINVVPMVTESNRRTPGLPSFADGAAVASAQSIPGVIAGMAVGSGKENNHPTSIDYRSGIAGLKETGTALYGWTGAKSVSDLLRNNKIECGSCHDPHEARNATFLRVANRGSAVCLGCHNK